MNRIRLNYIILFYDSIVGSGHRGNAIGTKSYKRKYILCHF